MSAGDVMAETADFLEELPISPSQREKLKTLGVGSPFALLSTIRASQDAFFAFFGRNAAEKLISLLEARMSSSEKAESNAKMPAFAMGAIVDQPARFQPPAMDFDRRDALLQKIEDLRRQRDGERRHQREIEELEREIASLY